MLTDYAVPQYVTVSESDPIYHPINDIEFKRYAKIDDSVDENPTLISQITHAATQIVEGYMGIRLHRRSVIQRQTGGVTSIPAMRSPVSSVTSIVYAQNFESAYVTQSATTYRHAADEFFNVNNFFEQGRDGDGYVITYTAGLVADTTPSTTPLSIKTAIFRVAAYLYECRQEYATQWTEQGFSISYDTLKGLIGNIVNYNSSARGVF
jgi:hypothetical protein